MSLRIWICFVIVINICICFCCCSVCLSDTSYVRCAERHNAKWMWLNELTRRQTLRRRLYLRLRQRLRPRLRRDAAITSERETQTKRNKTRSPSQGKAKQGKAWQSNGAATAQQQRSQFAYNSQWATFALLCCTRTSRRLPSKAYFCQVVTLYSYLDNSVYTWGTVKVMPDKI